MKRLLLLKLLIFSFFVYSSVSAFSTLAEAQAYAKALPNSVVPDNNNWSFPIFNSYHEQTLPSFFNRFLGWTGFAKDKFSVGGFKKLLESLANEREKEDAKMHFAEQLKPVEKDTFFIWGDLFGAFKSLVRDLDYLKQINIIDNSFKIIKPHYYLVFNGNVVDGSPYILETMYLIMLLMKKNPSHVFYIRGMHELEERWHNFALLRELKIRARAYSSEHIPLGKLVNRFFSTLPIGLFLTRENKEKIEVVLIANNNKVLKFFSNDILAHYLSIEDQRGTFVYGAKKKVKEDKKLAVQLQAFITGEDRAVSYRATKGLSLIGAFKGATKWLVFSSPTERNKILYGFHYDAFAELKITDGVANWTISLINQDIKKLEGFQEVALYNLVTGREIFVSEEQRKAKVLNFGATMDLSKGASPIGKKVKEGLELAFDRELVTDTIQNIIPQVRMVDDEYTPHKTRGAVEELVKDGVDLLIGSQGSASLESYLDLIKKGDVLVLFPFTGSPLFRKPDLKNLLHYRGSYIREGEELVNYALNNLKSKKIAIFYQDDAFGRGALEGARKALKAAGVTNFIEVPHERNVVSYKSQAQKIKEENPDTLLFSTNALAIRGLIRQLGVQYFAGKKLLGLSVYEDAFERFLKDKGLEFVLIRMVPDPATSDLQIAKEYREWADKKNLPYDKVSFEQYINANILFLILNKISGPITKEKIIEIGESFNNYPYKGLELTFNPETRELSNTLWIDPGHGEWIPRHGKYKKEEEALVQKAPGELYLGSTIDLSAGAKAQGHAVKGGLEMRLKQAQEEKMEHVPQLRVVDDAYSPPKARKDVENFLAEGVHTLICPSGSPTLAAYLDLVKEGKVSVFFPITGAPIFRKEDLTHMIHLRASYATEAKVLTKYAIDTLKAKKIVLFYQNDAFGKGLLDASKEQLQELGVSGYISVPYERNSLNFEKQVTQISEYRPDALLFFSVAMAGRSLIRQYGLQKIAAVKLLGNSDFGEEKILNFMKDTGLSFTYVSVMPNPLASDLEIVKQFKKACETFNVYPDIFGLEAYLSMDLLLNTIQNMEKPITRQKIMDELTKFDGKDYKGLYLKFDPKTRTLLHTLWMSDGTSEDWKKLDLLKSDNTH